jgi:hypothetical protein
VWGEGLDCVTQRVCDEPSSIPFWFTAILVALLIGLVISAIPAAKKPDPTPLKKAVDDVLAGYEKQAQVWGDTEAVTAFRHARTDVGNVLDKYKKPDLLE